MKKRLWVFGIVTFLIVISFIFYSVQRKGITSIYATESQTVIGPEIQNHEKGLTYNTPYWKSGQGSELRFKDYPFLENDFRNSTFGNGQIRYREPIQAWFNSANNLFLTIKTDQDNNTNFPSILIFDKDGNHRREIDLPAEITQNEPPSNRWVNVSWIGEKVILSVWIRDGSKRGEYWYIIDPKAKNISFVPVTVSENLKKGVANALTISKISENNRFLVDYCIKPNTVFGGCNKAGVALLNPDTANLKEIYTKSWWDSSDNICTSIKNGLVYIKYLGTQRTPDNYDPLQIDDCHRADNDRSELVIIPIDKISP